MSNVNQEENKKNKRDERHARSYLLLEMKMERETCSIVLATRNEKWNERYFFCSFEIKY